MTGRAGPVTVMKIFPYEHSSPAVTKSGTRTWHLRTWDSRTWGAETIGRGDTGRGDSGTWDTKTLGLGEGIRGCDKHNT